VLGRQAFAVCFLAVFGFVSDFEFWICLPGLFWKDAWNGLADMTALR